MQDQKLAFRMLVKYPGLTLAGGLALALAIGVGAGWYDFMSAMFRPTLPLPDGERIVEVEMRNPVAAGDERRLLHDFGIWRRDVRLLQDLGAYRTVERNLILGDAPAEPVTVAETSAAAFRVARVPPLLGRPLLDADEQVGAPPVVVIGYTVWQRRFGANRDVIGTSVQLGKTTTTVVGVMPENFAFPVSHRMWTPLQLRASGYAPLEGPAVRIFGRLAPGATQEQAHAELMTLAERAAAASPQTHEHLRPRVLAYGGESPGDRSLLEFVITNLPVLLVLVIACANVGTLISARTATREAEIATRYALGASRARIIAQLCTEALALTAVAAVVGLVGAHWALKWGVAAYYSGQQATLPFWMNPGLKPMTIVYAIGLTMAGAAILGVLPALKVTGSHVQSQLRNLGTGGATLRFGVFWTTAMIVQVALTVICIPPAMGISEEAIRDRRIRERFPAEQYLSARVELESSTAEPAVAFALRFAQTYQDLERRLRQEPGVRALTFGSSLPGMEPDVRAAEVEVLPGSPPVAVANLWTAAVGSEFFEAFDVAIVAGRDFHEGERINPSSTILVNEAFARRFMSGASPVGVRVRYASAGPGKPQPWFEVVGMVRDIGMTPTDLGEAPYIFTAASLVSTQPLMVGVRIAGDPVQLAQRIRAIAASVDPGLRLDEVRSLDEVVWTTDIPMVVGAGAIVSIVALGLFLSAAGIFALVSVAVARRTREIGLRAALGASRTRLLGGVISRAAVLVGSGVAAGNGVLLTFVAFSDEVGVGAIANALWMTSAMMFGVGLLACIEPARRALRIQPIDALKDI